MIKLKWYVFKYINIKMKNYYDINVNKEFKSNN